MASDGAASPLLGLDVNMKPGAALSPTVLPFPLPTPDQLDQPSWEPSPQPPIPSAFSPGNPLVLSAFANPVLVTGDGSPNPTGAGTGKVIIKVKTEAGLAEPSQTQNFILTQTALNWIASSAPCGGSEGSPARYMATSNVKTILPTQAVGVSQEGPPGLPPQALPPAAQLAPILPLEKAWLGPQGATGEGGPVAAGKPSLGELAYTSKGVYENFRRWQCYKALARRHLSQSPDTEALSCFLIPVLRSLAQLKPTMTLEEGLPRAVQEWEHTSNFDRMIFYEMAEKFMEFEAEEEQIQNAQLMNGSHGLSPAAPLKLDPPGSLAPEACQLPALPSVYIPKKAACKSRAPRRRQRKPRRLPAPEAPKEIPPEAVKEYIDIMEGLAGSQSDTVASGGKQEEEQQEDEGSYPDPCLLSYVDELCSQEVFVSKVEAVIHPQFLADLLSPEEQRDPLALIEELEQEEGLTIAQLVQKRLLALEEDEDMQAPPSCSGAQSDSSPSVSDEDEDGGGRPRPTPGPRGSGATVCLGKAASPGKRAREMHGGLERALGGPRGMHKDGNPQLSSSSWDRQLKLAPSQVVQPSLGMERRGSGEVMNQLSSHKDGYLGGAGSPGHCLVADRTSEALSLCWQEGPQPLRALSVDVGLADPAPVQGQVLEKQVLGLQTGQQMGVLEVLPRGTEPSAVSQEESLAAMWENDAGPSMVQSYDQNAPPGAAGDQDRALSPALWLSSEMDAVSLELPLQIEEVIESFENGECIAKHQALDSTNSISLSGEGESTVFLPSGTTDAAAAIELPEPPGTNSPALGPKENREQSPGTIQDTSDLWADGCSPLLEITEASTLGSPKDALLPSCQDNLFILGTQDAFFPQASQEAESTGNPFSPLEATEHINTLDVTDDCGFQLGVSEDSCLANFNSYDLQGEGREDSSPSSPKPNDLVSLQGNQESYILETPKSTSYLSLGSTSPTWDALVPGENSFSEALNSVDGVQKREKEEEEEDEQLSNFAYLLASKLSLSPRGLPLSPHPVSGGQGIQKASHPCAEVQGPGQLSHPVTKSGKRAPVGGLANAVKRPQPGAQLGVSGENPLALGMVQSSQPRKRRRDSFATGRKKKRRRSQ